MQNYNKNIEIELVIKIDGKEIDLDINGHQFEVIKNRILAIGVVNDCIVDHYDNVEDESRVMDDEIATRKALNEFRDSQVYSLDFKQ